ncbi:MAG: PIG-L family deacetylase [Ornithinimicrobium sp.]
MSASDAPFSHTDEGTPESVWWSCPQWDGVRVLDRAATAKTFTKVIVAAAHPDDETLGIGGLVTDLAGLGVPVTVLVATAGERSQPGLDEAARTLLGTRRRREVEQALSGLAPRAHLTHLGLPDTELRHHGAELAHEIAHRADHDSLILAPWTDDGHQDHDALGAAATVAAAVAGSVVAFYPIWLWHWSTPSQLPWESLVASETSLVGCWRKRAALESFQSQHTALVDGSGRAPQLPILGPTAMARGRRMVETLIDPQQRLPTLSQGVRADQHAARAAEFDRMYDGGSDPWGNGSSFYEERRRNLVLAMLGARRYRRVLELGCADGYLTSALAGRADEVVALDTSARAVAAARATTPSAHVEQGNVPDDIPAGRFDLIVLSEVGYFLTPTELIQTVRRADAALAPGGELVLCHWQHPTKNVPLDGPLVHDQTRSVLGRPPRARHREEDLCIEVWGEAPSIAASEGRV